MRTSTKQLHRLAARGVELVGAAEAAVAPEVHEFCIYIAIEISYRTFMLLSPL